MPQRRQCAVSWFGVKHDWSQSKYCKNQTHYEDEVMRLKENKVEIHTFYMRDDAIAKNSFEWMAKNSYGNGKCHYLDIAHPDGAKTLTNLVSVKILKGCGEQLVEQYKQKFMREFS